MMLALILFFGLDVSLKPGAAVAGNHVYLSDVLDSESLTELRKQGLDNLKVAAAPAPGRSRILQRSFVVNAIQNNYPSAELAWSGPASVKVSRRGGSFSETKLDDAVRAWIEGQTPAEGELRVDRVIIPRVTGIPSGNAVYEVRARGSQRMVGRRSLYVDILIKGRVAKTLAVQVEVSLETMVAKVLTDVPRGSILRDDHVEWEYQRLTRLNAPLVTPDQFEGIRARTPLRPGMILDRRKVEAVPLVERNQMAYVVARHGGLSVRMKALAMESGGVGDRIRLKNVDSNKILTGLITKSGEVSLDVL